MVGMLWNSSAQNATPNAVDKIQVTRTITYTTLHAVAIFTTMPRAKPINKFYRAIYARGLFS
jgi:hypothetical protein